MIRKAEFTNRSAVSFFLSPRHRSGERIEERGLFF
jgi:hypothetical protein